MATIKETNAQYYSGQQVFPTLNSAVDPTYSCTFNTDVVSAFDANGIQIGSASNYTIYIYNSSTSQYEAINESLSYVSDQSTNTITLTGTYTGDTYIELKQFAINNNYGNYAYITLGDVINNFMVGYVGYEKIIPRVNKTDVIFHAKRGLQEFSYDLLKVLKSQELTIPPSLTIPMPQDYVNYVKLSWVDEAGGKHIIYPTRVTSNPTELPIQDGDGVPTQDWTEENIYSNNSLTEDRWASQDQTNNYAPTNWKHNNNLRRLGGRYGLQPEEAQINGKYTINDRLGTFNFTSDLVGKLIILEYISDGIGYDKDMKIPKLAEQAIYMHIIHAILSTRKGIPEYIINRYKRERSSAYRNAKIRLSNIKVEEIAQVMRNKSKWIKH
tara:strand:- start:10539 stop:11687 length:1149 start_codon:yes stop_codon:yes gene_type:complete